MIDWSHLTDEGFESLCYDVLVREGYKNLIWIGRSGGDRGRDIVAQKTFKITENIEKVSKCVVQCKRYLSRPLAPSDLRDTLAWAERHSPDMLLIMVPKTLTADTHDWLDGIRLQTKYDIFVYEEKDFEVFFDKNREVYTKHFGQERISPKETIISLLLDEKSRTLDTIVSETRLPKEEVPNTLAILERAQLLSHEETGEVTSYSLQHTITAFVDIANQCLAREHKFDFLTSHYSKAMIGSRLIDHIESRYHLRFPDDQKEGLVRLFKISPSALHTALFQPTDRYETGYAHLKELKLDEKEYEKWNQYFTTILFSTLLEKTLMDLRDSDSKVTLQESGVEGYYVGIRIKMANIQTAVLNVQSESVVMIMKASGPIKDGQLVATTDPSAYARSAGILLNLELYEPAISEYNIAMAGATDRKLLLTAWNNKGVCYLRLGKPSEALPCFEKALEIDPSCDGARKNLQICKKALGME
jgi:tetratricopeptide (TPR) repeat protein